MVARGHVVVCPLNLLARSRVGDGLDGQGAIVTIDGGAGERSQVAVRDVLGRSGELPLHLLCAALIGGELQVGDSHRRASRIGGHADLHLMEHEVARLVADSVEADAVVARDSRREDSLHDGGTTRERQTRDGRGRHNLSISRGVVARTEGYSHALGRTVEGATEGTRLEGVGRTSRQRKGRRDEPVVSRHGSVGAIVRGHTCAQVVPCVVVVVLVLDSPHVILEQAAQGCPTLTVRVALRHGEWRARGSGLRQSRSRKACYCEQATEEP